jgi:hypothetical protein
MMRLPQALLTLAGKRFQNPVKPKGMLDSGVK